MNARHMVQWLVLSLLLVGCGGAGNVVPAETPTEAYPVLSPTATSALSARLTTMATEVVEVPECAYVPGVSTPARLADQAVLRLSTQPTPTSIPFQPAAVDAAEQEFQMGIFRSIAGQVEESYIYEDVVRDRWPALREKYEALVSGGLNRPDFYRAMQEMVAALGDTHSHYLTPEERQEYDQSRSGYTNFVGIGVSVASDYYDGADHFVITGILTGSPAEQAGLKSHDSLLAVDGGPVLDANGMPATLGQQGSELTLTVQSPGEQPREVRLVRAAIRGSIPFETCRFRGTRLYYARWHDFLEIEHISRMRKALSAMGADGPADGLVLDLRNNVGGELSVEQTILRYFVSGQQGAQVSHTSQAPLVIDPADISGSQSLPLVVLVDSNSISGAELVAGILQNSGRAKVVGQPTAGELEGLLMLDLPDGSRLFLASVTFQPEGKPAGVWDNAGITPDVYVPGLWSQFTEANDPGIAAALDLLQGQK